MRQTTEHRSYIGSRAATSRHGLSSACHSTGRRRGFTPRGLFHNPRGFTLIELVVAMAILLVVMIGILSSISFAYNSSTDTELRNTAKNIATYSLEYLRSRTVTHTSALSTTLSISSVPFAGTYGWYDATNNPTGAFPSMVDMGDLPLQSNGWPCNYTSTYVAGATVDGDTNPADFGGIVAGGAVIRFASKHAAWVAHVSGTPVPAETYAQQPLAFTSTLQGYVSVRDMTAPGSTQDPAPEDKNLAQMLFSGSNVASGTYRTKLVDLTPANAWTNLVVRYPGVYPSTPPVITSFTAGSTYLAKVYTTDAAKMNKGNQAYNPYYTNAQKAATQDYRGFRVLTQVAAWGTGDLDTYGFRQVQYYDVTVNVLWMSGTRESNYELVSRIVAY